MRALIFLSIIALANYHVVARIFAYAPVDRIHWLIPVIIALLFFGLEILDLRTTFLQTYPALKLLISATTGAFFCALFFVMASDLFFIVVRHFVENQILLKTSLFYFILIATALSTAIGVVQATAGPKLKEVTIAIKNLPPAFEGYKIVQVSDLHVGGTIRKPYVQNVVDIVNSADADLIALTGDFADGKVTDLRQDSALLADMKSKDGSYFVTGNHEYYHDLFSWLPFYKSIGIEVLQNENRIIRRGEDALVIAGVTDYSTRGLAPPEGVDIARAGKDMPQDAVKVLLMHQPNQYKEAAAAGFDLQLSGHTHGGQFFPWTLVVPFFHNYFKGLNRFENLQIYISVGTGYWGPALRTFVPTEVTLITLRKE